MDSETNKHHNFEWFTNEYWNKSVKDLVNDWQKYIDSNQSDKHYDSSAIAKGILNGDAGYSFSSEPYVEPDQNIDTEIYENVRGDDRIESVLKNKKQMQYTHTQDQIDGKETNKYLRLLMPKYLRRVEVEDLNRNFWVISQVIGLISDYLLNPNSPLNTIINGILKEITQIWDNIYQIWKAIKRIDGIDERINKIAEATQKTKVSIDLDYYFDYLEKGKEIRNLLGLDKDDTRAVTLENLYFLYQNNAIIIANLLNSEDVNEQSKSIIKNTWNLPNNPTQEDISGYMKKLTYDENDGVIPWDQNIIDMGFIIQYKIQGESTSRLISYDRDNLYYPLNDRCFGLYKWGRRVGVNGACILINEIIHSIYFEDEEKGISLLSQSPDNDQFFGPIKIERDGVNKKPLNKILTELAQFNFALLDCTGLNYGAHTEIVSKNLFPIKHSLSELMKNFIASLALFSTNAMDSYNSKEGENVSLIWTIPAVICKAYNIEKSISEQKKYSFLRNGNIIINNLKNSSELRKKYQKFMEDTTNNDTYFDFLLSFLEYFKLSPKDIYGENYIINATTEDEWLNNYETQVKNKVKNQETDIYKIFNNQDKKICGTYCAWALFDPASYQKFTNIFVSSKYLKTYRSASRGGLNTENICRTISWKMISSITPIDCFQIMGGKKLISSNNNNGQSVLKLENIYSGKPPLSSNESLNGLSSEDQKNSVPLILGGLTGWKTENENENNAGMMYIQPYRDKSLDNYWISFSSGNQTGGRVQIRVISSNYRFFSPFEGIKGIISSAVGRCYDCSPHNTSITIGYCQPEFHSEDKEYTIIKNIGLNRIIQFNCPEYYAQGCPENSIGNYKDYYNYSGDITPEDTKRIKICRRNGKYVVIDGFLGCKKTNPSAGQEKNYDKGSISNYYEGYNNLGESNLNIYFNDYNYLSPSFTVNNLDGKSPGTFHKIRPVHPYCSYGIKNSISEGMTYNQIKLKDILSEDFFAKDMNNQRITIQVDFSRFAIGGASMDIYATISLGKDAKEIGSQERLENFASNQINPSNWSEIG